MSCKIIKDKEEAVSEYKPATIIYLECLVHKKRSAILLTKEREDDLEYLEYINKLLKKGLERVDCNFVGGIDERNNSKET